jgi:hypothetical protein
MHSIYCIHIFDVYLLHVSVFVHYLQGEQVHHFLEEPTTITTLLSLDSILCLIYHVKCVYVRDIKATELNPYIMS